MRCSIPTDTLTALLLIGATHVWQVSEEKDLTCIVYRKSPEPKNKGRLWVVGTWDANDGFYEIKTPHISVVKRCLEITECLAARQRTKNSPHP